MSVLRARYCNRRDLARDLGESWGLEKADPWNFGNLLRQIWKLSTGVPKGSLWGFGASYAKWTICIVLHIQDRGALLRLLPAHTCTTSRARSERVGPVLPRGAWRVGNSPVA